MVLFLDCSTNNAMVPMGKENSSSLHLFILLKGNGMVVTHKHKWIGLEEGRWQRQTLIDEPFFLQPVMKG